MNIAEQCRMKVDEHDKADELVPTMVAGIEQDCLRLAEGGHSHWRFDDWSFLEDGTTKGGISVGSGRKVDRDTRLNVKDRVTHALIRDGFKVLASDPDGGSRGAQRLLPRPGARAMSARRP